MPILKEDSNIRGTYQVEKFLGEGAFAEVYRVRHKFLGRQAMKIFKRIDMTEEEVLDSLSEAILLTQLKHPNLVSVYDADVFDTSQGRCGYFTMEYVSGGSLDRFWRSHDKSFVPIESAVDIIRQVCRGIATAHDRNPPIIHRDIKPQNILVGYEADGLRARVGDFGLAKQVNPLTLLATAAGTLSFKPPEAFQEQKSDSCAADVWAIGVTLYLLLTDRLPFKLEPALGWYNRKAFDKAVSPPSAWNGEVDHHLDKIVMLCLEKSPENRYPTARKLLDALDNWEKPVAASKSISTSASLSEISKKVLGTHSPADPSEGKKIARQALSMARNQGKLTEAADLMEEAFNKSPSLRSQYASQVRMWRCGIAM
jgi:serine/threonine protein kinase